MPSSALGKYNIRETLKKVTVNSMEDVRAAALVIKELGDACGFRIGLCDDVASRDPIIDEHGNVLSKDILAGQAKGSVGGNKEILPWNAHLFKLAVTKANRYGLIKTVFMATV